jgi:nitric oxide reductase subunit B
MNTELSSRWRYGVVCVALAGLGVLTWIALNTYTGDVGTPIPTRVVDSSGQTVFTGADIVAGQQVFQKHGLMENGTIWGHGAYLGPDFSAAYLHQLALDTRDPATLSENRYDPKTGTLRFTAPEAASYRRQIDQWKAYFAGSTASRGLSATTITDPDELRELVAFFAWTAWGAAAHMPGKSWSYTQNFPYEPLLGNGPSGEAVLWSALSLITLLAGTGLVLLAFGRFDLLGWKSRDSHVHPQMLPGRTTASRRATLKFFVVVALLFLVQVLVGGGVAHYRAQPGSFYGFDLAAWLPSNVLRTRHLQSAIFWIVTAYVGGGLFVADALGSCEARGQVRGINVLGGPARPGHRSGAARSGTARDLHVVPDLRGDDSAVLPARVVLRQRDAIHHRGYLAVLDRPPVGRGLSGTVRDGDGGDAVLRARHGDPANRGAGHLPGRPAVPRQRDHRHGIEKRFSGR